MSKIEDIADTEFNELLEQVDLGELDVVESHIDEWQDMSEKLLGIVLAPVLSMSWMAPCDGRCGELCSRIDVCQGPSSLSHLWV